MNVERYVLGARADVLIYVDDRGNAPAHEFIEDLPQSDQKKVICLLQEFADRGEIRNREKFRHEEGPIFAFKSFRVRLLCFYYANPYKRILVLTHGLSKKRNELPPAELERAHRIRREILSKASGESHETI